MTSSLSPTRHVPQQRLSAQAALELLRSPDLHAIGRQANQVREALHGNRTTYIVNLHINQTNICTCGCRFCAFHRSPADADAYTLSQEEFLQRAAAAEDCDEIHVVGGNHPGLGLTYYETLLSRLKQLRPSVHAKCLTAVEIVSLARREGLTTEDVLRRLQDAGLDSLPGGGAEIFAPRVREALCPRKATAKEWLDVHRSAHRLGLPSTCTMLYGTIETDEERLDHLEQLRRLQDETGGFTAFIPLAYQPWSNDLPGRAPNGVDDLKMIAISRLFLDNIPHIKAYWIMLGLKLAQVAQAYGADDLDGTIGRESISHEAGAASPTGVSAATLCRLIRETGRDPVRRDALYNPAGQATAP